jgi:hypothetical protein
MNSFRLLVSISLLLAIALIETADQDRPPFPLELDKSNRKELQELTIDGADIDTVGVIGLVGFDTLTLTDFIIVGLEQVLINRLSQYAYIPLLLTIDIIDPTTNTFDVSQLLG